jgi:hypothetical protein
LERFAVVVCFAGLASTILIGGAPFVTRYFTRDDTFYYLQIARNVARGSGSSFDGLSVTNGYQLLWQALLEPLAVVFHSRDSLLVSALILACVLVTAGGARVARFCRWACPPDARKLAYFMPLGLVFAFAFNAATGLLTGMESALTFLVLALLVPALVRFDAQETPTRAGSTQCCLLLVVLVFCRQDYVIAEAGLVAALGLLRVLERRARPAHAFAGQLRKWRLPIVSIGAGWALSSATYFAIDRTLIPVSGLVKLHGGTFTDRLARVPSHLTAALFPFLRSEAIPHRLTNLSGIPIVLLVAAVAFRSRPFRAPYLGRAVFATGVAYLVYSAVVSFGVGYVADWYLAIAVYFYVIFATWAVVELRARQGASRAEHKLRRGAAALGGLLLACCIAASALPIPAFNVNLYAARRRLGQRFAASDCRFAAFNAGALGYFSNGRFTNLDGVVNSREYRTAILGHPERLRLDLEAKHISVLVDYSFVWAAPMLPQYVLVGTVPITGSPIVIQVFVDPKTPCAANAPKDLGR